MYVAHYPDTGRAVVTVLWLLLQAGGSMAAAPVYRCIDEAGQVEFSQFLCPRGAGDALRAKVPKIGWQMASPRPSVPQKPVPQRAVSSPQGGDRKAAASQTSRKDGCWKAQRQLQQIARRLRKGYRRDEGERLRRQREGQEAYVSRFCPTRSSSSR